MFNVNIQNMVCVKTCLYRKVMPNGQINFMTAVYSLPKEEIGKVEFVKGLGSQPHPFSNGTMIFHQSLFHDPMLIRFPVYTTLAEFEYYLRNIGWEFKRTITVAKKQPVREAFKLAKVYILAKTDKI